MNIRNITVFIFILLLGTGCTKNFRQINTNPDLVTRGYYSALHAVYVGAEKFDI